MLSKLVPAHFLCHTPRAMRASIDYQFGCAIFRLREFDRDSYEQLAATFGRLVRMARARSQPIDVYVEAQAISDQFGEIYPRHVAELTKRLMRMLERADGMAEGDYSLSDLPREAIC